MKKSQYYFLAQDFDELYRIFKNAEKYAQSNDAIKFLKASKNVVKLILSQAKMDEGKLEEFKDELCDCWDIVNNINNLSEEISQEDISEDFYENILNQLKNLSIWFVVYNQGKHYSRSVYSTSEQELVQKYYEARKRKFNSFNEAKYSIEDINTDIATEKKMESNDNNKEPSQFNFIDKIKDNSLLIIGILSLIVVVCIGVILFGGKKDSSVQVIKSEKNTSSVEKPDSYVIKNKAYSPKGYMKDLPNPIWMDDEVSALNRKLAKNNRRTEVFNPYDFYYQYATDGYANAQFYLAYCYLTGFHMDKNIDQAKFWYEKAADQGLLEAQTMLKKIKSFGGKLQPPLYVGGMEDSAKSQYLERYSNISKEQLLDLANSGDAYAQYRIGQSKRMYGIKNLGKREQCKSYMQEAEQWLIKSANQNCLDAMLTLYVMYEEGYGIGKNPQKYQYYKSKFNSLKNESTPYRITSININREKYTQ